MRRYAETDLQDPALDPIRQALERIVAGHRPYPAVIADRHGDLVSGNAAFRALVDGVAGDLLEPPVSVARVILDPRGLAPRIANLDVYAWHVIDAVRERAHRYRDGRLEALAAELEGVVPERGHPAAIDVTVSELSLEAFRPGDAATARALADADRGV